MSHSLASLAQLITDNAFDQLIGERESEYLDAKEQPYHFATNGNHAKRELAKDITSFANVNGGYIIIGLTTTPDPLHPTEQITALNPVPRSLINADQYYKLINEWIYPAPNGVTITRHECGAEPDHILGIITIPPQDPATKPFLIAKTVDETKTTDITLGYAERRRDTTKSLTLIELQHALRLGLNMERELLGRLAHLQTTIDEHFHTQATIEGTKGAHLALKLRTGRITGHDAVKDIPRLILSATPIGHANLRTILSNSNTSIRYALAHPPTLRSNGWSLDTGATPQLINGEYLQVDTWREVTTSTGMAPSSWPHASTSTAWRGATKPTATSTLSP